MEIIEKIYGVKSIVTEMNYFRFEFQGDERVQDKGMMKRSSFICCYQTLERFWNEKVHDFSRLGEPFDKIDLE